jgi:hypothetical protein
MKKYEYLWVVQGFYSRYGWEDLCASDKWIEAKSDLKAYRDNEPGAFRLIQRRVKNEKGCNECKDN